MAAQDSIRPDSLILITRAKATHSLSAGRQTIDAIQEASIRSLAVKPWYQETLLETEKGRRMCDPALYLFLVFLLPGFRGEGYCFFSKEMRFGLFCKDKQTKELLDGLVHSLEVPKLVQHLHS